jgi:AraC family transcriptional regulator
MSSLDSSPPSPDLNEPAILELALMLVREATDPGYRNSTMIEGLSYALAMRVMHAVSGTQAPRSDRNVKVPEERVRRVLEYIEEHVAESVLSLDELASVACLSVHQFGRLFKSSMGQTPHQFIVAQRIARAKLMMLGSNKSLSEIAFLCGFANQAHFTTRFRDVVGETPNGFKARMNKNEPED